MPTITKLCLHLFKVMQRKMWPLLFPDTVYTPVTLNNASD